MVVPICQDIIGIVHLVASILCQSCMNRTREDVFVNWGSIASIVIESISVGCVTVEDNTRAGRKDAIYCLQF